jgi:N6-adenosine-specific RNA methylase IME4
MERTRKPTKAAIAAQEAKLEHDHYALEKALEVFPKTEKGKAHTGLGPFEPSKMKEDLAKIEGVKAFGERIRSKEIIESAVEAMIERQQEFVPWWDAVVRDKEENLKQGPDGQIPAVGKLPREDAEKYTGISHQQVSVWRTGLKKLDGYRVTLYGKSYRLVMEGSKTVAKDDRDERSEEYKASRKAKHLEIEEAARADIRENVVGPFPLIYADPPWKFETYSEKGLSKAPDQHYPTLAYDEIKAFEVDSVSVKDIAHKDAALFLWCTSSNIPMALEVLEAWGFEFKSSAVWVKDKSGTGLVFRNQHEVILYGTKGKMPGPQFQPSSVFSFPRGKHSAKPDEVRKAIEKMYPDFDSRTRLELFARETVAGWTPYGFEAGGKL